MTPTELLNLLGKYAGQVLYGGNAYSKGYWRIVKMKEANVTPDKLEGVRENVRQAIKELTEIEQSLNRELRMKAYASAIVRNNRTQEPEVQVWPYFPNDSDPDWNDADRAWFKSSNTGAGALSGTFTASTDTEAIRLAKAELPKYE